MKKGTSVLIVLFMAHGASTCQAADAERKPQFVAPTATQPLAASKDEFQGVAAQLRALGVERRPATAGTTPPFVYTPSVPATSAQSAVTPEPAASAAPATLEETRLAMDKWIETQQIISKERKDWQQGREILTSRLDLIKKEIATLEEKTEQNRTQVSGSDEKRRELDIENVQLKDAAKQLTERVTAMETRVRELFVYLPEPLQQKLKPLYERVPEEPGKTNASIAERFQNVLGILNEVNKASNEITVNYEVHTMSSGKPAEVKAVYIGLAQAYYVSAKGEAGIGRPGKDGWKWESSKKVGPQVLMALEIMEGKHTPVFVPLPVRIDE